MGGAKPKKTSKNDKKDTKDSKDSKDKKKKKDEKPKDKPKPKPTRKVPSTAQATLMLRTQSVSPMSALQDNATLVSGFIDRTLKKGLKELRAEFMANKRTVSRDKTTVCLKNMPKNRYKDVPCLDEYRVVLRDCDNDYIHANFVATPKSDKRFICCQAPTNATQIDHWRMIVQEQVEAILMLCNYSEGGREKCAQYFPTTLEPQKTFGPFTIKLVKCEKLNWNCQTPAIVNISTLEVEQDGIKVHELTHYHWVDWPDRGVPPVDMSLMELLQKICTSTQPIVVHCSAGIGRTGAVVLIQSSLETIAAGYAVREIETLMRELRNHRANSVQTVEQYLYVHMYLLHVFVKEGWVPDEKVVAEIKGKFTTDYEKAAAAALQKLNEKPTGSAEKM